MHLPFRGDVSRDLLGHEEHALPVQLAMELSRRKMLKTRSRAECYLLTSRDDAGVTSAVVIPDWGANVLGLTFQAHDWAWPIPILEAVDIATIAAKPASYGVPILAPTPGRVGHNQNGRFRYGGKDYSVRPSRHGFLRNLEWTVASRSDAAITCVVDVLPDAAAAADEFPFEFRAEYQVEITSRAMRCRLRIHNTGGHVQPIAVGWHPYLHRTGECVLCLPARSRWELDQEREPTPTGRILAVGGHDDFRAGRLVNGDDHWDDVFTDLAYEQDMAACWVEETVPTLLQDGTNVPTRLRRTVNLIAASSSTGPRKIHNVQLYTPPDRNAICIEPLSAPPNAINLLDQAHEQAHVCELQPNDSVVHTIIIGLEIALE